MCNAFNYNNYNTVLHTFAKFSIFISYKPPAVNAHGFSLLICIVWIIFWIFTGILYQWELYLLQYQKNWALQWFRLFDRGANANNTYMLSRNSKLWSRSTCPGKLIMNKWNCSPPRNAAVLIASSGLFKFKTVCKIKLLIRLNIF